MTANRGIEDPSVLYLQPTHISSTVSFDNIDQIIKIWAWSRITLVNPDRDKVALHAPSIQVEEYTPIPFYGARWNSVFSYTHAPTHSVRIIRECFDRMNNDKTEDDYIPWFERITVRVIYPTVHGFGYIPMSYDLLLAGQSSTQHNFSTSSTHSHRSSSGPSGPFAEFDPHSTQQQSFFDTQQSFFDT
ncbi:serine/threonine-protein phosphatase 7 long form [Dorcoceras hygrometricum]|uniref:Serine/threonine-protein phosphatase 7 long form n=1 Tax=Dorcoceras hygrometricum TaxID=472368 RepID=A0A2Z7ATH5_9LAMI|nr:serine/threonine-protein phosphatase 7 long form [Dorcoceras hygrometricum]